MQLEWTTSVPAGALRAALALLRGQCLTDPALAQALRPATASLRAAVDAYGPAAPAVAEGLLAWAGAELAPADLVAHAVQCAAATGSPDRTAALGAAVAAVVAAYRQARPRAGVELELRVEPLRQQWEARGPGLLFGLRKLTSADLLVADARVILVEPVLGGGGVAHPRSRRVTFEAVLANPLADLPEVLRLGWLLAQLNGETGPGSSAAAMQGPRHVQALALVPAVLAAAEEIELARADERRLRLALSAWLDCPAATEILAGWWTEYRRARPAWPAALSGLAAAMAAGGRDVPELAGFESTAADRPAP